MQQGEYASLTLRRMLLARVRNVLSTGFASLRRLLTETQTARIGRLEALRWGPVRCMRMPASANRHCISAVSKPFPQSLIPDNDAVQLRTLHFYQVVTLVAKFFAKIGRSRDTIFCVCR